MNQVTHQELVRYLEKLVLLMELEGENEFKVKAYRNALQVVENGDSGMLEILKNGGKLGVKGIGISIEGVLREYVQSGRVEEFMGWFEKYPKGLFELLKVQGLGVKRVVMLYQQLKIDNKEILLKACEENKLSSLKGFGPKLTQRIKESIIFQNQFASSFTLDVVTPVAFEILGMLQGLMSVSRVKVAGSFRRGKEWVNDLDFLVSSKKAEEVMESFVRFEKVEKVLVKGVTKTSVILKNGLQCDLRVVSREQYPFALQYFTGSKEHNVSVRRIALKKGWSLNEYGLTQVETGEAVILEGEDEKYLYEKLGMDYIEPELRENQGEIEAAQKGALPRLIELENLRGTFHNHTTWSDGEHTLEEMAEEARNLGMQYLGIADHSRFLAVANGLSEERLMKQVEEIKRLNERWDDFKLLSGSEVDILMDGELDYRDEVLEKLDYVVASVHQRGSLNEEQMTERILKAMKNPYVTMIGHLTGRKLLEREGYGLDMKKILETAAETGTMIEINANPLRLDMDWRWWKRAAEMGILTSINPDAHHRDELKNIWYGVKVARKGWLERANVINTYSLEEVKRVLRKKREFFLSI
jgi:DNA polymerase (family 10)